MATPLLNSLEHACFHSRRIVKHEIPDLHHCIKPQCPGAIAKDVARRAGFMNAHGEVLCPHVKKDGKRCLSPTYPSGARSVLEVHAQLCSDATIHYPELRKSGAIGEEQYQAWFATLTREEKMGYYKRVPSVHLTVQLHDDEVDSYERDPVAAEDLIRTKLRNRAEVALLHQTPHRRKVTTL